MSGIPIPQPLISLNPLLFLSGTGLLPCSISQAQVPSSGNICPHLDDEVCERPSQCLEDVGGLLPWLQASCTQGQLTQSL